MAKYSYFLVKANHETGEFSVDEETLQGHLSEGQIFDSVTNTWEKIVGDVGKRDNELWNALCDGLQRIRVVGWMKSHS